MTTMNISLPSELKEYVESQAADGYGSISEFIRELVREHYEFQRMRDQLLEAAKGPFTEVNDEFFEKLERSFVEDDLA